MKGVNMVEKIQPYASIEYSYGNDEIVWNYEDII